MYALSSRVSEWVETNETPVIETSVVLSSRVSEWVETVGLKCLEPLQFFHLA